MYNTLKSVPVGASGDGSFWHKREYVYIILKRACVGTN